MNKVVQIVIALVMVLVFSILAVQSWNGWLADEGNSNNIIAGLSSLQVWLVTNLGQQITAGIFAVCAVAIGLLGIFSRPQNDTENP